MARDSLVQGSNTTYKAFGYGNGRAKYLYGPQRHRDFGEFMFWRDEFLALQTEPEATMSHGKGYADFRWNR